MISKKNLEHIAKLARIELTEKEKEKFTKELSSVLDYVDKLNKVDTSKSKTIKQITGLKNIMREDKRSGIDNQELRAKKLLEQAPSKKNDYYKVPRVLE